MHINKLKYLAIVLFITLIISLLFLSPETSRHTLAESQDIQGSSNCSGAKLGDVNCDGKIDVKDFKSYSKAYRLNASNQDKSWEEISWGEDSEILKRTDFDQDKEISLKDYEIWRRTYYGER